jgi:hypothetical protein
MPKIYDQARCHSCEQIFRIDDMLKDIFGNHICQLCANPSHTTGVMNGISQAIETCCRCGKPFPNTWGAEEPPLHRNHGKPCCPSCIGLDCVSCGRHHAGRMRPIPGTPYSRCFNCSPPAEKNQPSNAVVAAQARITDRG